MIFNIMPYIMAKKYGDSIEELQAKTAALENQIGDIDTALDGLHAYAQAFISGGKAS